MFGRSRQSTAQPTPRRGTQGTPHGTQQTPQRGEQQTQRRELPPHEPPAFPLNPTAQRELATLVRAQKLRKLNDSIADSQKRISDAAADLNDRVTHRATAVRKQRERERAPDDLEELERKLAEFQGKADSMTQRMDETMRKLIDQQQNVKYIGDSLASAENHARNTASTQASTQNVRSQRPRRGGHAEGEEAGSDEEEEYPDFTPTDPAGATQPQQASLDVFRTAYEDAKLRYESRTAAERYVEDGPYGDFRRVVHDACHPDDDVDMPPPREWFTESGAPAPGITNRRGPANDEEDDDEDDDLAVSKATISTKCPITLKEFENPLTSKRCSHSFESAAIKEMIGQSATRTAPGPGQRGGEKAMRCPVGGCKELLSMNDLEVNKVLVRKIQRLQKSRRLQEEGDDDDDDGSEAGIGTQRRAQSIDDDAVDDEDAAPGASRSHRPKSEPKATATPAPTSTAARVIDLGGSDEEEDEEDIEVDSEGDTTMG
ncbi:unnamed protein product [Zymoseptoria tritici ST99CH_3D7]|uniref:SP-RING-type domain-containing protein n=2 Tax=Zymoseptoria tritici TaxID=1047171 RepID=A0A1X7RS20_ZYMT9|nr:unnamed protein product [Zymoseptoria tritici ST99CH_3D7]SMR51175.1 unnamed protein product [Zymoseptoria tritici ST99CH_1E4]